MGRAKDLWMEIQERGFDDVSKTICSKCVDEYALKHFIQTHASCRGCSYCGRRQISSVPLSLLVQQVLDGIRFEWDDPSNAGLAYESAEGGWQGEVLLTAEVLDEVGLDVRDYTIIEDVCGAIHNIGWCERDPYSLTYDRCLYYGWKKFCDFVCHSSRYVFLKARNDNWDPEQHDEIDPVSILDELGKLILRLDLLVKIPFGKKIHRVRVDSSSFTPSAATMGSPPLGLATIANRMSPAGISMFYGAFDLQTAIEETYDNKSDKGKKVYCSTFRPVRELTVVDLASRLFLPSIFDAQERKNRAAIRFLQNFISDFRKPIDRKDRAHIDYVPTQIVTEFFRHVFENNERKVDGIIYPSSKGSGNRAVVIFADNDQCLEKHAKDLSSGTLQIQSAEIREVITQKGKPVRLKRG